MTAVLDAQVHLKGIFTDGDLRRALERMGDVRAIRVDHVMTSTPLTVTPDLMAVDAARIMDERQKNVVLVVDDDVLVGALHMHDLMKAKVI